MNISHQVIRYYRHLNLTYATTNRYKMLNRIGDVGSQGNPEYNNISIVKKYRKKILDEESPRSQGNK